MNKQLTLFDALAEELIGTSRKYYEDHRSSDWNGCEVGFHDVSVVGLYSIPDMPIYYYVDTEIGVVLDAWAEEDED